MNKRGDEDLGCWMLLVENVSERSRSPSRELREAQRGGRQGELLSSCLLLHLALESVRSQKASGGFTCQQ